MTEKIENISFDRVDLKEGFWQERYRTVAQTSVPCIRKRFEETGRFDAVRFNHYKTNGPLNFAYDSDVAKFIEGVALLMRKDREAFAEEEAFIDELVESMEKHRRDDGYLNSYFQQVRPEETFRHRLDHELYCAGHLIEAAIEYKKSTGKDQLYRIALDYVDCIERAFITDKTAGYVTCGHEEIELALYKLYRYGGNAKHLEMAKHFLFARGRQKEEYYENVYPSCDQSAVEVFDLERAEGHAVMANYLYMAMADVAFETQDERLYEACRRVWKDITDGKMYITGGVGSTYLCEAFTVPYDLDNLHAYCESCACIAFLMFNLRMQRFGLNACYADVIERILYNNLLSSFSEDGKSFFYENPLETDLKEIGKDVVVMPEKQTHFASPERKEVFECSCCPPNIVRTVAKLGDLVFSETDDSLVVNQFIACTAGTEKCRAEIRTDYPLSGKVTVVLTDCSYRKLYIRKPSFAREFTIVKNGREVDYQIKNGYIAIAAEGEFTVEVNFRIRPRFVYANPAVRSDAGKVAVMRGPVVYCMEGIDNSSPLFSLSVDVSGGFREEFDPLCGLYDLYCRGERELPSENLYDDRPPATEETELLLRPYFYFANRGKTDMQVFVRRKT